MLKYRNWIIFAAIIDNSCQEVNFDGLSKMFNLSDKTIQKYLSYLQQAFLVQTLNKNSFKSMERIRNTKSYIVDPGLQNNRENSMTAENSETSALIAASDALQCSNLTLVAFAETRDVEIEGKVIHIKSALDWLLTERDND